MRERTWEDGSSEAYERTIDVCATQDELARILQVLCLSRTIRGGGEGIAKKGPMKLGKGKNC